MSDSEDESPPQREALASTGSDSDKENDPPLQVPLLPWPQRQKLAGILTRIAFGHETMSSAVMELRDLVLFAGFADEDEVRAQEEHRDPPVAPAADEDSSVTESESDSEENPVTLSGAGGADTRSDSGSAAVGGFAGLASRLEPGFNKQCAPTTSQQRMAGGSVAAVVAEALNYSVKRKADAMEPSPQNTPKKHQIRRRVVPTPTESQVERDERRREEYKETNRQRLAEGLSPRKPRRRHIVEPPSPVQTPSTQLIEEILGYNFHGSQAQSLQSGFQRRG